MRQVKLETDLQRKQVKYLPPAMPPVGKSYQQHQLDDDKEETSHHADVHANCKKGPKE